MTKYVLGFGLLVAGILLVSDANAERYRRYRSGPLIQSRSNIFGGYDYQNGTRRIRSIPNIHGGFNYQQNYRTYDDNIRYRPLYYRRSFTDRYYFN